MTNEIAALPTSENSLTVFSAVNGLDPYLAQIKSELDAFVPDVSTKKGRDAIASIAHKVAKSKTALDNIGKDLVAELKDVPKKIDAERKRMRDTLDKWKDDVRKPLTDWEDAEKRRIEDLQSRVEWFSAKKQEAQDKESSEVSKIIEDVSSINVDSTWQEFEADGLRKKVESIEYLNDLLTRKISHEEEQKELARLRAEAAEREQKEREERIAKEAAERAVKAAEEKARAEKEEQTRRQEAEKAEAERRELALKLEAERAYKEKLEADQRAAQAQKDAEAMAKKAAEDERIRIQAEKDAELDAQKKREANRAHKGAINRKAMQDLISGGLSEDSAKLAITLIAGGKISNISINY